MNLRYLFGVGTKLKENIYKNNNQISWTVTTRTWVFCQQNGPERGQVKYWYTNEKKVMVHVCLNGRSCSSGWVGIVSYPILSYPKMKSLPLLAFRRHVVKIISLKYSKEDRLCSSHVGIRIIPSDVWYDNDLHFDRGGWWWGKNGILPEVVGGGGCSKCFGCPIFIFLLNKIGPDIVLSQTLTRNLPIHWKTMKPSFNGTIKILVG